MSRATLKIPTISPFTLIGKKLNRASISVLPSYVPELQGVQSGHAWPAQRLLRQEGDVQVQ